MTTTPRPATLARLPTGVAGLDEVLGGGFPRGAIVLLAGEPGTGKTVLALQTLFSAARRGERGLYLTTLSEPALKVIRFMQLLEFFDARLLDDRLLLADLGAPLRTVGADATLTQLIERVERERPALVVIDSFKAIHDLVEPARRRSFIYDLAVTMAGWGATTLLIGEYRDADLAELPEFAVADGVVLLRYRREALAAEREIEVRKLRGAAFTTGVHYFDVGAAGITCYPRVRAPQHGWSGADGLERAGTGVAGLDRLLRGGVPRGSTTLVVGGSGTGKTLTGLAFLVEGARRDEPGILLGLEETPDQLRAAARAVGWDLSDLERRGLLVIEYAAPVEISPDRFLHRMRALVRTLGARRVVLDSLTSLELGTPSARRFKELVYSASKHLRAAGATAWMTMEVPELLGQGRIAAQGVSFAADNLIYLRYVETRGRLARALAIVKARGMEHGTEICRMTVGAGGIEVGPPLGEAEGVLSGARGRDGERP